MDNNSLLTWGAVNSKRVARDAPAASPLNLKIQSVQHTPAGQSDDDGCNIDARRCSKVFGFEVKDAISENTSVLLNMY